METDFYLPKPSELWIFSCFGLDGWNLWFFSIYKGFYDTNINIKWHYVIHIWTDPQHFWGIFLVSKYPISRSTVAVFKHQLGAYWFYVCQSFCKNIYHTSVFHHVSRCLISVVQQLKRPCEAECHLIWNVLIFEGAYLKFSIICSLICMCWNMYYT